MNIARTGGRGENPASLQRAPPSSHGIMLLVLRSLSGEPPDKTGLGKESSRGARLSSSSRQVWPPHPSPCRHLLPIDQFVTNLIPSVYVNNAPLPLPRPHKLARFFPGRRRSCSNYCWMGAAAPAVS
ncbi:hypothetical protein E2C01_074882 [Portunus trituberculatus]|uniref:Uncharacterized protein n=1 Tax=Portunus trituberculatus TaxID=210409 RepID=A0A5B7IDJ8_PORTR|nr:hypothetical protein [Portunus trituberculatus]